MPEMFDYLNAITYNKKNIMEDDPFAEKEYKPYYINKNLEQHIDCFKYANEMNYYPFMDNKMQFDFLINSIRKKFRKSSKWLQPEFFEYIKCVKEYFNYSNTKAKIALDILSEDDLAMIKYRVRKGGAKDDRYIDRS